MINGDRDAFALILLMRMQMALRAVRLLLKHGADTDLLCDGHSPLSLAITSGNDMVCIHVTITNDIAFSCDLYWLRSSFAKTLV